MPLLKETRRAARLIGQWRNNMAGGKSDEPSSSNAAGNPQSIDQYVGARIRSLREARGMDLSDVGARIGATAATVARHEQGEERPSPGTIIALARLFRVGLSELFPEAPGQLTGRLN
jgi:ribosome-binding protein aMBF1 (putative translation factor)